VLRFSDIPESVSQLPPGAILGKVSPTGHRLSPGLRRALGLILIAGLCVSAVTFYSEAPELPRPAPAIASGTPLPTVSNSSAPTPSGSPSPKTAPTSTRTTNTSNAKPPKGPGTTQPGILLMASPYPDGSFDVAEIVLLSKPTSMLRLGPPRLAQAGSPSRGPSQLPLKSK
jgi:hypothetical protein